MSAAAKKRKVGRPRVSAKEAKGSLLSVRLSEAERKRLEHTADKEALSLSKWARRALLDAAEK